MVLLCSLAANLERAMFLFASSKFGIILGITLRRKVKTNSYC